HAAGHPGSLEDTRRGGAGADRAGGPVVLVVAVGGALALEVVALHGPGEALALGDGDGVDPLAGAPQVGRQLLAHLVVADVVDPQFHQPPAGVDPGLLVVAEDRLVQGARPAEAPRHLQGRVALTLGGLHLDDAHRRDAQDSHRDGPVLLVPDLGHADFFADDGLGSHALRLSLSTRRGAMRSRRRPTYTPTLRPDFPERSGSTVLDPRFPAHRRRAFGHIYWDRRQEPLVRRTNSRPTYKGTPSSLPAAREKRSGRPGEASRLRVLDLDLDVDAGGQVQALQGIDRLRGVLDDVDQALVHPH